MADQAAEGDIFVYTGGRAPQHVVKCHHRWISQWDWWWYK